MTELHLYDWTDNALRRWGYADVYCEDYSVVQGRCLQDRPGILHAAVASLTDVISWIRIIGQREQTIDELHIHSHGNIGYIHLPNGGITISNVSQLQPVCSQYLARPGRVLLYGCNVAEGPTGQAFLIAAGRAMLGHGGGIIGASDSKTFSVPGLGQRLPVWATLHIAVVSPSGTVTIQSP
ncbi:MAG: DUF4347 domain-containing protein [Rhodospirillaceae bacterium]|nr:DUF4347 domain-containing protein [Rhodospirillaceae bacterium]